MQLVEECSHILQNQGLWSHFSYSKLNSYVIICMIIAETCGGVL